MLYIFRPLIDDLRSRESRICSGRGNGCRGGKPRLLGSRRIRSAGPPARPWGGRSSPPCAREGLSPPRSRSRPGNIRTWGRGGGAPTRARLRGGASSSRPGMRCPCLGVPTMERSSARWGLRCRADLRHSRPGIRPRPGAPGQGAVGERGRPSSLCGREGRLCCWRRENLSRVRLSLSGGELALGRADRSAARSRSRPAS